MSSIKTTYNKTTGIVEEIVSLEEAGFFIENSKIQSNNIKRYTASAINDVYIDTDVDIALVTTSGSGGAEIIILPDELNQNVPNNKLIKVVYVAEGDADDVLNIKTSRNNILDQVQIASINATTISRRFIYLEESNNSWVVLTQE